MTDRQRAVLFYAHHPYLILAFIAVAIVSWSVMTWAEVRWNRPAKPLPPPRYRRKPRTAAMRSRR